MSAEREEAEEEAASELLLFGTVEMFVASEDIRGGTGANFVVERAAQGPISEPLVETVMLGAVGTTSYSFVSQGRSLRVVGGAEGRENQ